MGGAVTVGPRDGWCQGTVIDAGTLCLARTTPPGSTSDPLTAASDELWFYSPAVRAAVDVPFAIAPGMTWDGFWRLIYDNSNAALQKQANLMLEQGRITAAEAAQLVNGRNELLLRIRQRLTPFGGLYSELLKSRASLKSLEQFVAEKGTIEAVLRSMGNTRVVVDKIAVVSRVAGPAVIVLEISMTAIVIQRAAPHERGRVAAREIGGLTGSVAGGLGGMWAGCATAALLASPSLVVPIVGKVSTGGACLVGGILGGLGVGWFGRKVGESAGEGIYQIYNDLSAFRWAAPQR